MNREEAKKRATELVEKMTVEEIASQLRFDAPAIDRLGIPAYNWWNEGLHGVARAGVATMFPQAIGLGATFDEELLKEVGDVISTEARAKYNFQSEDGDRDIYKGITLWSPNVNLFRTQIWRSVVKYKFVCFITLFNIFFIYVNFFPKFLDLDYRATANI